MSDLQFILGAVGIILLELLIGGFFIARIFSKAQLEKFLVQKASTVEEALTALDAVAPKEKLVEPPIKRKVKAVRVRGHMIKLIGDVPDDLIKDISEDNRIYDTETTIPTDKS